MKNIAVIGTGQMGLGIAYCAAEAGFTVQVIKFTPGSLAKANNSFHDIVDKKRVKNQISLEASLEITESVTFLSNLLHLNQADLVIETVVEDLSIKNEVLPRVESFMRSDALLASNTSSLPLHLLTKGLKRPENFLGVHFFNPVPSMKLVELSSLKKTSQRAISAAREACEVMGKTVVEVQASPGYVVNRLLLPYLLHAIETLEARTAPPESIDTAMKLGCGHPMGPLSLADLIGLDVVMAMSKTLYSETGDPRFVSPRLLIKLVEAGELGRKTGRGIFDYNEKPAKVNSMVDFLVDSPQG